MMQSSETRMGAVLSGSRGDYDFHVHSRYSPDASPALSAMADAAHRAGLVGMAFTEHIEWLPGDEACGYLEPQRYYTELVSLRGRYDEELQILAGLELGNPHDFVTEARALLDAAPWDYVLGSLHWPEGLPGWEPVAFEEGLEIAYRRYFRELVTLAEEGAYDVLAHFDLVRRDSWGVCRQVLPIEPYESFIRAALTAVVERDKGLEINTSALAAGLDEPCPGLTILRWYRELGGEILVFGSDAHHPEDLAQCFDRARSLALEAGFDQLARFERRRVVEWLPLI